MSGIERDPVIAYVALGSNIGDRETFLQQAAHELAHHRQIEILASSPVYETEPVGYVDQAAFLNQVAAIRTTLTAHELLHALLGIEQELGRTRDIRWGPRTIDLDLLLFGEAAIDSPKLAVPHPRMEDRAFVMIPLVEVMKRIEPLRAIAFNGKLDVLTGKEGVVLWKKAL